MYRILCWAQIFALFAAFPLLGQESGLDPTREIGQYSHHVFTKRDGLPQNSVTSVAQTPDGYLWFGTMEGLARFDGTSFSTLNTRNTPQLGINYVRCLLAARDSTLWVGTDGAGLLRIRRGEAKRISLSTEQENVALVSLREDSVGDVWASSSAGLAQLRGDSLMHLYTTSDGLPTNVVYATALDRTGRLLALTHYGVWVRERDCFEPLVVRTSAFSGKAGDVIQPHSSVSGLHTIDAIPVRMLVDRRGALWLGTLEHGIVVYDGDAVRTFTMKDGIGAGHVTVLFEDQRGTIWAGTSFGGLMRIVKGRVSRFTSAEGLSADEVLSIKEDREGVLWVGTSAGGVNRFINSKFTTFRTGQTAVENMVWGIFVDPPGRLMASTAAGTLVEYRNGVFVRSSFPARKPEEAGITFAFVRDHTGVRWLGTSSGVVRHSASGAKFFPVGNTMSVDEDRYGRVWVASADGLWCDAGSGLKPVMKSGGTKFTKLRQIVLDRKGTLWLASRDNGLFCYRLPPPSANPVVLDETTALHFAHAQGLSSNWITSMNVDSTGTVWVPTFGGGLNVIRNGKISVFTSAHGLPEEGVMGVALDGMGSAWLTSNNGIHRLNVSEVYDYADGRRTSISVQSFGTSDGMYSDEFNGGYQSCIARTADGKLWFPSTSGIVMVDPARLPHNPIPPAIVLERVRIDNMEGVPRPGVEYPPGNGDLEFHFAGLSSIAPERIQYRYMLEGFNKDWIDAGTRRDAYYTNIPPGKYRFRVIAVSADGVWNEAGIAFPFELRPRFSQTVWFGLLIASLILAFIVAVWFFYKRDRDRELLGSQLESKLAQAQVQILEMQLQPHFLFNTLNGIMVLIKQDPDMASRMIARLSEFLRLTLESAGEQEVTLRRELDYLNRYIQIEQLRFGDRLTVEQSVNPDDLEALVPNLILQPIVENAIRHGVSKRRGPARICIEALRDNGSLTIHVRDNGSGLPSNGGGGIKEGIGLRNTRTRLQYLYGAAQEFGLTSPEGGGVDVRLRIPYHKSGVV